MRGVRTTAPLERVIILFHDNYKITAEALPTVIHALREQNLEPTLLGNFRE